MLRAMRATDLGMCALNNCRHLLTFAVNSVRTMAMRFSESMREALVVVKGNWIRSEWNDQR